MKFFGVHVTAWFGVRRGSTAMSWSRILEMPSMAWMFLFAALTLHIGKCHLRSRILILLCPQTCIIVLLFNIKTERGLAICMYFFYSNIFLLTVYSFFTAFYNINH